MRRAPAYERITFNRNLVIVDGSPRAQYVAAGHPLLDVTVDLIIVRFNGLMQQGAASSMTAVRETCPARSLLQHAVTTD